MNCPRSRRLGGGHPQQPHAHRLGAGVAQRREPAGLVHSQHLRLDATAPTLRVGSVRVNFLPTCGSKSVFISHSEIASRSDIARQTISIGWGYSYTWTYGSDLVTTVTFNLESVSDGTRLRLEQRGFDAAGEQSQYFRKGADYGWGQKFLKQMLPSVVARLAAAEPIR